MFSEIQRIVYEITGKQLASPDTDFIKDLELNSFDIINVVCAFEEEFDVAIPTRDVWNFHNVADVMYYMKENGFEED